MPSSAQSPTAAREWLRTHGFRLTKAREGLIALLLRSTAPLALAELRRDLPGPTKVDFATVFRFVQLLEQKALVTAHSWGDRQYRYELAGGPGHSHHHHHLVCRGCARVEEVDVCALEKIERSLREEKGYAELSHSLEFFGMCPTCQRKKRDLPGNHAAGEVAGSSRLKRGTRGVKSLGMAR